MENIKAVTVGNGSAVHAYTEETHFGTVYRNTACGAVEVGGNALYGHRRKVLRDAPEGAVVTCKRCLKSLDS